MRLWLGAAVGGIFIYGTARWGLAWAAVAAVSWTAIYVLGRSRRQGSR